MDISRWCFRPGCFRGKSAYHDLEGGGYSRNGRTRAGVNVSIKAACLNACLKLIQLHTYALLLILLEIMICIVIVRHAVVKGSGGVVEGGSVVGQ